MEEWIKISDLLFFQEGPGVRNTQYTQSGVKLLNVANLVNGKVDLSTSDRYISEDEAYGRYKHFLCDDGDFIIASSGIKVEYFDRKMGFVDSSMLPLCMNTSTIRFKVIDSKRLNIKYFMYYLKSIHFKQQLSKFITGSAQLNFGPSHLKKMNMPLVSLKEQNDIVEKLSKVELLLDKYNGEIKLLDELIKARFVEMFGDPVVNDKKWEIRYFCDLGELKRGKSKHRPRNDPILLGGKYPLIQTGDVTNSNTYIKSYTSTYSEEGLKQSKMWKKGTLCITIAANIAESAILTFDACFPDSVVGFTPNGEVISLFIHYWLSFLQPILEENAPAVAQKNLNVATLEKVGVIVPPLELQNQFASFVQEIAKSRSRIQKSLEASQELFDSLMQEYFG